MGSISLAGTQSRQVCPLSLWHGEPDWEIEHVVRPVSYVGSFIADYSITHADEKYNRGHSFSRRSSLYGGFDLFSSVCPKFTLYDPFIGEDKVIPQLDWMQAQLILKAPFGIRKLFAFGGNEVTFKPYRYIKCWRLPMIFNHRANPESDGFFSDSGRCYEFNVRNGEPCPLAGDHVLPVQFVRGFGGCPESSGSVPQSACIDCQKEREHGEENIRDSDIVQKVLKPIAFFVLIFGLTGGGSAASYFGLRARDAGRWWRGRCLLALGVLLAAAGPLAVLLGWPLLRAGLL